MTHHSVNPSESAGAFSSQEAHQNAQVSDAQVSDTQALNTQTPDALAQRLQRRLSDAPGVVQLHWLPMQHTQKTVNGIVQRYASISDALQSRYTSPSILQPEATPIVQRSRTEAFTGVEMPLHQPEKGDRTTSSLPPVQASSSPRSIDFSAFSSSPVLAQTFPQGSPPSTPAIAPPPFPTQPAAPTYRVSRRMASGSSFSTPDTPAMVQRMPQAIQPETQNSPQAELPEAAKAIHSGGMTLLSRAATPEPMASPASITPDGIASGETFRVKPLTSASNFIQRMAMPLSSPATESLSEAIAPTGETLGEAPSQAVSNPSPGVFPSISTENVSSPTSAALTRVTSSTLTESPSTVMRVQRSEFQATANGVADQGVSRVTSRINSGMTDEITGGTLNLPMIQPRVKPEMRSVMESSVQSLVPTPLLQRHAAEASVRVRAASPIDQSIGSLLDSSPSVSSPLPISQSPSISLQRLRSSGELPMPLSRSEPQISRQANPDEAMATPPTAPNPAPPPPVPAANEASESSVDIQQLAQQVSRILTRQFVVDRERRGGSAW